MKLKNNTKIHFETMSELFEPAIKSAFGVRGQFYNIIDTAEELLKMEGKKKEGEVFVHETACMTYLDGIFKKMYKQSIYKKDTDFIRTAFYEVYMPYLFYKAGKKIFKLSKNLSHMLLDTSLNNIDSYFLELPFRCIFLRVPDELNLLNPFGIPVTGIYIALLKKGDVNYLNMSEQYHHFYDDKHAKSLIVTSVSNMNPRNADDRDTLQYWHMTFTAGDLFNQMRKYIDEWQIQGTLKNSALNKPFTVTMFSFILNAILYINSSNITLKETKPKQANINKIKNKKKKRQALKRSTLPFYPLGEEIMIGQQYNKLTKLSHKEKAEYMKHTGQYIVRGHWRQQAHGEKLLLRKPLWIEPYVKGKEFTEIINKTYKVK